MAALTCPLPGLGTQLSVSQDGGGGGGTPGPGRGRGNRRDARVRTAAPASTPLIVLLQTLARTVSACQAIAGVVTFRHGAESGEGRRRLCEGSIQVGPVPSLGGEMGERAAGTAAALVGGPLFSEHPGTGLAAGAARGGQRAVFGD